MSATVEVEHLRVTFRTGAGLPGRPAGTLTAVDDVSLTIPAGQTLGLVGESGSGKSTLGQAMLRLVPATGRVRIGDRDVLSLPRRGLRQLRSEAQVVFQDPYGSLNPRQRIGAILAEPLAVHRLLPPRDRPARVRELLDLVGLRPDLAQRYPHQLSGGQRQRVAIARALAVNPSFLVLDEPVSALDVSIQAQVLNLLVDLRARLGLTYLFVGHDLAVVRHVSDRIAVMYLGRIVEEAPAGTLLNACAHPYTRGLVSALPVADPETERVRERIVLTGDLPSPITPPPGCTFHPRCWLYTQLGQPERCRAERPELRAAGPDQSAACHFSAELATSPLGRAPDALTRRRHVPVPVPVEGSSR
ncbi:dipeptide ABC transporter ATP-binding protein [Dactylosporangium fulvum]|uniref:ATP-binding cassette domain-containing protein n=2 Tax=Dactylosporangium fulvum TaxID=53359 RepID=A0ABY5WCI6_9ACTN|nr:oligopeptide/dipeptide ABC transporter ATP-binding protein [Dactylosporangium fulvum]UWP86944.1 ATP-binding cassette domain-containing protein [Dactylosporangium fulvum]